MSGVFVRTVYDNEQYAGDPSNNQSELQTNTNALRDNFLFLPDHSHVIHGPRGNPRVGDQNHSTVSMDFQSISDLRNDEARAFGDPPLYPSSIEYIDPSVLAMPESHYGTSMSAMTYDYQNHSTEAQTEPLANAIAPGYGQQYIHIVPENSFIPEVLGRTGYQAALGGNTAHLSTVRSVPNGDGSSRDYVYDMSSYVTSDVHDAAVIVSNRDAIVPDKSANSIEAQQGSMQDRQLHYKFPNGFQVIVRKGTPVSTSPNRTSSESRRTSWGQLHPYSIGHPSSDASSPTSTTSTDVTCPDPDCEAAFSGKWQKSNLNRHLRLKHASKEVVRYPCEHRSCRRKYLRKDARLKHYRNAHPHLSPGPPVTRTSPSSTADDQIELQRSYSGHDQSLH